MTTKSPSPRGPLDRLEPRGALAERVQLLVQRALGDLGLGLADLEAGVVAEGGGGPHLDRRLEGQRPGLRDLLQVEVGVVDRLDAGLGDRLRVPLAERALEHLLHDGVAADALDDHLGRRLAGAEPGDADVPPELADRPLHALLDLVLGDLDVQPDAVLLEVHDLGGQRHRAAAVARWMYAGERTRTSKGCPTRT